MIVQKSKKYNVPARMLTAILMQESGYNMSAINRKSKDFGIAQINSANIRRMGLDQNKLLTSMEYSVEAGAMILASYKRFQKREPLTWLCRYNVGNRPLSEVKSSCMTYLSMVQKYVR